MTDPLRAAVEKAMREPTRVVNGVCLSCGGAVLNNGNHVDVERHAVSVAVEMIRHIEVETQARIIFALRELHIGSGCHNVQFIAWKDGKQWAVQPDKITGIFTALEHHCAEVYKSAKQAVSDYEAGYRQRAEAAEKERDDLLESLSQTAHGRVFQELRRERNEARRALADALNWWEPQCKGGGCDKGSHNEEWEAWQRATSICAPEPGRKA